MKQSRLSTKQAWRIAQEAMAEATAVQPREGLILRCYIMLAARVDPHCRLLAAMQYASIAHTISYGGETMSYNRRLATMMDD